MICLKVWNLKVNFKGFAAITWIQQMNNLVVSQNTAEVFLGHFSSRAELN